jgi:hypothetical protein
VVRRQRLTIPRFLGEAARQGGKLFLVMAGCSAVFILLSLVLSPAVSQAAPPPAPPPGSHPHPSQPLPLPSLFYASGQILLHVVSGFAAGALSLDPVVALVGAGVAPLLDLDHIGFFAGLPVDARVGHSFLMVALIVLLDWRLHFWGKGTRNLFLFISLEFSVHLAVAPPGFPLLAPLSATIFYFPRVFPAALAAFLAVGFFFDYMSRSWRTSPQEPRTTIT